MTIISLLRKNDITIKELSAVYREIFDKFKVKCSKCGQYYNFDAWQGIEYNAKCGLCPACGSKLIPCNELTKEYCELLYNEKRADLLRQLSKKDSKAYKRKKSKRK